MVLSMGKSPGTRLELEKMTFGMLVLTLKKGYW